MGVSEDLVSELSRQFKAAADPANAVFQKAYMKDHFEFFGIKTELRRKITNALFRQVVITDHKVLKHTVMQLWKLPQREFQYAGQELLYHCRKIWTAETIGLIEYCITHKSWWDTVDYLSTYGAGHWLTMFPGQTRQRSGSWNCSGDMWLNRCSILFQLKYKKNTDTSLLEEHIVRLSNANEFFIQKAIGWALREYSKTNPAWVRTFIRAQKLAPLSIREGSKYI